MAKIKINYPEVAKGAPVEVPGIGVFPNGEESEYDGDFDLTYTTVSLDGDKPKSKKTTSEEGDK